MTERRITADVESPPPPVAGLTPPWGQEAVFAAYHRIQAFVFSRLGEQEGEDVVEKVLEVVLRDVEKVTAKTQSGFESWCLGVARNKVMDAWRSQYRDRLVPMDPQELLKFAESAGETSGLSLGVRDDLHFIFGLLHEAKPPCVTWLYEHMIIGVDANVMAENYGIELDTMRRRIERCFALAKELAKKHP
jgi:DNA-directed RNA polymerase specialized sigma24 family protein